MKTIKIYYIKSSGNKNNIKKNHKIVKEKRLPAARCSRQRAAAVTSQCLLGPRVVLVAILGCQQSTYFVFSSPFGNFPGVETVSLVPLVNFRA